MNGFFTIDKYCYMWQQGDTVMVEMNMSSRMGTIWNKDTPDTVFTVGYQMNVNIH